MTGYPAPDIVLDVNLRNPGQFFACCGVLELASRMWPGSEAWFVAENGAATFRAVTGSGSNDPLGEIVDHLLAEGPTVQFAKDHEDYSPDRKPVILRAPFDLRLDWWLDSYRGGDKSELKVWAGKQTPEQNFRFLKQTWSEIVAGMEQSSSARRNMLGQRRPIVIDGRPKAARFGVDPSASWEAQDVGFSPDEQGYGVAASPATEILAAIGLQRCRPVRDEASRGRWFVYHVWADPIQINVAQAAVAGVGRAVEANTFRVVMRNSQYGNFGWAKRWEQKR
jgi:hypothetical protein